MPVALGKGGEVEIIAGIERGGHVVALHVEVAMEGLLGFATVGRNYFFGEHTVVVVGLNPVVC